MHPPIRPPIPILFIQLSTFQSVYALTHLSTHACDPSTQSTEVEGLVFMFAVENASWECLCPDTLLYQASEILTLESGHMEEPILLSCALLLNRKVTEAGNWG